MSADGIPTEWYFITAPQEVSFRKDAKFKEIDTYGTNNPYLNYGTTKLRQLSISNARVEGFSDSKEIENNITELQACMRMVLEEESGYTSPYCWKVFAGDKCYGTYIITSVNVAEELRDMTGNSTRSIVDVEFQEVSEYQIDSGIDISSTATVGDFDPAFQEQMNSEAGKQDKAAQEAKDKTGKKDSGSGSGSDSSGSGGGGDSGGDDGGGGSSGPAPGVNTGNLWGGK